MRIPVLLFTALSLEATLASQEQELQRSDPSTPPEKIVGAKRQITAINSVSDEQDTELADRAD